MLISFSIYSNILLYFYFRKHRYVKNKTKLMVNNNNLINNNNLGN